MSDLMGSIWLAFWCLLVLLNAIQFSRQSMPFQFSLLIQINLAPIDTSNCRLCLMNSSWGAIKDNASVYWICWYQSIPGINLVDKQSSRHWYQHAGKGSRFVWWYAPTCRPRSQQWLHLIVVEHTQYICTNLANCLLVVLFVLCVLSCIPHPFAGFSIWLFAWLFYTCDPLPLNDFCTLPIVCTINQILIP